MNLNSSVILQEAPPLSSADCIYVIRRKKTEFTFPIHTHSEFEINYVENASGAQRVVGDSVEEIEDYDLVLITGENLRHAWQTHKCSSENIFEITIQFSGDWLSDNLQNKNQFLSIKKMFEKARNGVVFSLPTILKVRPLLNSLTNEDIGFYSVINFLSLLYELSVSKDMRVLATSTLEHTVVNISDQRIRDVEAYIEQNYCKQISLADLSDLACMSEVAFSRYFRQQTGKSVTDHMADIRLGHVTRMLIDTDKSIAEICYECGYNNISNFNRIFKKKKGCSPREYKDIYLKKQVIF